MKKIIIFAHIFLRRYVLRSSRLPVHIDSSHGLFAQLNWCLYIAYYCEKKGLRPTFKLTNANYFDDSSCFLGCVFKHEGCCDSRFLKIKHISEFPISPRLYQEISIAKAHLLFFDLFSLQEKIKKYTDEFVSKNFGKSVLGLHLRGTDKKAEAPPLTEEMICQKVDAYLEKNKVDTIFVASDEARFISLIKESYESNEIHVCFHEDLIKSQGGLPIHLNNNYGDKEQKLFEALVNSLLLSRTDYLIKGASFLSAWSCIFNPNLSVELINIPYKESLWFPDSKLI
ncbi:conserved hypothetical protein [Alteromonas infernus]